MPTCPHDTLFHDTNVGGDRRPRLRVIAECDGPLHPRDGMPANCGFVDILRDADGREHEPRDWWISAREAGTYSATHEAWSRMTPAGREEYAAQIGMVDPYETDVA